MENILKAVAETVAYLQSKINPGIDGCLILGTGLGNFIDHLQVEVTIPYNEIPNFPESTVESHKGNLVVGKLGDKRIIAMQGRYHFYEGYSMQQITFPVRVLSALGAKFILLSNAAGGMNPKYKKADLVLLEDHINKLPGNPLRGLNDPKIGNRFVDMSKPYDEKLSKHILQTAKKLKIKLRKGVYVAVEGPSLETRAEYRYLRGLGADMVGMSTVPEVIVANQLGLSCAAISVITDECDPDHLKPIDISEIIATAAKADKKLSELMVKVIEGF